MPTISVIVLCAFAILSILVGANMMKIQERNFTAIAVIHALVLALLFTISSIFWTTDMAHDADTLKRLEFGWPFPYLIQNQEKFEPPFPHEMFFAWEVSSNSPDRPAMQLVLKNLVASIFLNFLVVSVGWRMISPFIRRRRVH